MALCAFLSPAFAAGAKEVISVMPSMAPAVDPSLSFVQPARTPDLLFGLLIGVMLTAALYLFFIWVVLRDRSQILLMLLLMCLSINMACTNQSLTGYLGIRNESTLALFQNYSLILAYLSSLLFTHSFLEVETNTPLMRIPIVTASAFLALLLTLAVFRSDIHFLLPSLGAGAIGLVLTTGLLALRIGVSGSLSHITAFSFFLLGTQARSLYDMGTIMHAETANNLMYGSYAIAAMMFAFVIANQFASRQEDKEKELEVSNERFTLAARGSNEGLFDWDRTSNEMYISEQFRKIANLPRPLRPKNFREWLSLIHPPDRITLMRGLKRLRHAEGTATINVEYRIRSGNGDTHWIHTKMVAVKAPHARHIERLVGSIGDITLRKRSESALRASELRFRSITEAHPVPVLITNLKDNAILYASPGAETLLGMAQSLLLSNALDRFLPRQSERHELIAAMAAGQDVNMKEVTLARGDGDPLPAALSARRIQYQSQDAMVVGLYDLTERKKAEAQIAQQQEALQQSEKMAALGGLLAGVAHELNNPLSVVMGQTTLLMETQQEEKTKTRAEKIFKAADRCSRIVKSFLSLARRKAPVHKNVDLAPIIHGSLELLHYQFRNENVSLALEVPETLPAIIGDDDQLTQVFSNLALNAVQAMRDHKGARNVTIRAGVKGGTTLLIEVIDTGPGIPAELKKKVFEPFFSTKTGTGGTGVGLALCLNIIESHNGVMRLEDTPGGGATFIIELPLAPAQAQAESAAHDVGAQGGTAGSGNSTATAIGKYRILLVDDEVELAQTLADLLEPEGHEIDLAANGAIALDKLRKRKFDYIISDLRMPVMDGPTMYAEMKEHMPQMTKRVIYVTGDTLSPHVNAFLSETPVPVIEKPYRLKDVTAALARLIAENGEARI